jgi:hypothetical protein
MKRRVLLGVAALGACGMVPAWGQMHAVKKPDEVVRAVAVYEWTGEEGKATASRVVPVSLFIDGQYQDAAIYMARPVPFALDTGTVYEVRKSGIDSGTLELLYERHLTSGDTAEIDDGWLGYGEFKVKPKETLLAKKQSGPLPQVLVSGNRTSDSGGPKMVSRSGSAGDAGSGASSRSKTAGAGTTAPVGVSDDDPDSPTLHRRPGSAGDASTGSGTSTTPGTASSGTSAGNSQSSASTTTASTSGGASSTDSDDEADRPTLKRRTPSGTKAGKKQQDSARVVAGNDLNDDPDRPTLHRGSKTMSEEEEVPPLRGTPKDMKQLVAVSDAKDRPEHDFVRQWESSDERAEVLGKMQAFAHAQLAEYKGIGPAVAASATSASATSASASTKRTTAAARAAKRKAAAAATAATPAPPPLKDEVLKAYTLSYGGAPTYVYSAVSPGANGVSRYVSVVAQEDAITGLKVALASVTDSSHLDRTPWMRFVDVVDADASNRASLLMELRAQHTRQFALYRVIGAQADQVFLSGSTE